MALAKRRKRLEEEEALEAKRDRQDWRGQSAEETAEAAAEVAGARGQLAGLRRRHPERRLRVLWRPPTMAARQLASTERNRGLRQMG